MMDYRLVRTKRSTMAIYIRPNGVVEVRAPIRAKKEDIEAFVASKADWIQKNITKMEEIRASAEEIVIKESELPYYKGQLACLLQERCAYFAARMGVEYGKIKINKARTRWGSCNSKGDLNFSIALVLLPGSLVDYVVVHELAHRKEMNHLEKFWKVVEKEMPDWKDRKKRLREVQRRLKLVIE